MAAMGMSDDLTPDEIHDRVAWLKDRAREGANRLHATAATTKAPQLTDAEHAAIARKRLDKETNQ
jgi:hypothetical protein